jgi:hypothetical protein
MVGDATIGHTIWLLGIKEDFIWLDLRVRRPFKVPTLPKTTGFLPTPKLLRINGDRNEWGTSF